MSDIKVAMVTPELYGSVMVGGLAMAVSGLTKALRKRDIDARVIIPAYVGGKEIISKFLRHDPADPKSFAVKQETIDGIPVYIINGLNLGHPYTYEGLAPNIEDFAYREGSLRAYYTSSILSASIPNVLEKISQEYKWTPSIVHLHDWPVASTSYDLKQNNKLSDVPIVVTIHNANYIGKVPFAVEPERYILSDSPIFKRNAVAISIEDELFSSLLEMGIVYSDAITTVSPNYAQEILAGSHKIDGRIVKRVNDKGLEGILNGVDYGVMNPQNDPFIVGFNPEDMESVAYCKGLNKLKLHEAFGIRPNSDVMQISMMSRLAEQKGIYQVLEMLENNEVKLPEGIQLIIVGESSESTVRNKISRLSGNAKGVPYFAKADIQHLILAGSDAILMPSIFEPCGLTQLEGMRYGALPITTQVGGLKDTVIPFDGNSGYGIIIDDISPKGIAGAIKKAHEFYQNKETLRKGVKNALSEDFSWDGPRDSVGKYIRIYEGLLNKYKS